MKIFLTGGTGFIGRWVVPSLVERGHELGVLIRRDANDPFVKLSGVRTLRGDLNEPRSVEKMLGAFKPDSLVHLAWEGLPDYSEKMCFHNFHLSLNLFKMAADIVGESIISTGSCWEYASRNGVQCENAPLGSDMPFPAVKNALRFLGDTISKQRGKRFCWLRLFFVYGSGQKKGSLIPSIISALHRNEKPAIETPENANDFIFVEDVAGAIGDVLEKKTGQTVYNIGSGQSSTIRRVVQTVFSISGKPFSEAMLNRKQSGDIQDFHADISAIETDVGWKPRIDLQMGIEQTINHIRNVSQ